MKYGVVFILLVINISSCYEDKSCQKNYIGIFKLDSNLVSNQVQRLIINRYRYDTVKLYSNSDGIFKFDVKDKFLQDAEGSWFTKSNIIEGNCSGYIKQKNLLRAFISEAFDIMIIVDDSTRIDLPFRRIK